MMWILEERAADWRKRRGYEVVGSFEDTLEDWRARERKDLTRALALLAAGRADVLGIQAEAYEALSLPDREWLRAACEKYGGRLEMVPDLRMGWGHDGIAG
jgi:flagellar biosynthesis regulator FlaF